MYSNRVKLISVHALLLQVHCGNSVAVPELLSLHQLLQCGTAAKFN